MGYNTTIVVMNDALHQIAKDEEFGKKLYDAILAVNHKSSVDVSAGNHCNAATVIETHHADGYAVVAVGHNYGEKLGTVYPYGDKTTPQKERILRALADQLGFSLRKKPTKKKKS